MFLKQSFSFLVGLGSLAVCSTLPAEAASLNNQTDSIKPMAEVRHNNGALISLNGELLPFDSDYFPVLEGDIIEMNRGFTDFSLLITNPDSVLWNIQIFPGDSFASFNLEDYFVNTEQPFSEITNLPSGDGNVIAYGFDPENSSSVVLTALSSETTSVPEPTTGLGILIAVGIFSPILSKKT